MKVLTLIMLIAREDYIKFTRRESTKTYIIVEMSPHAAECSIWCTVDKKRLTVPIFMEGSRTNSGTGSNFKMRPYRLFRE
jgi:hypothetical protein